ncbi:MAG: A/G-specific adenine glycosylase [Kineosporiaceae bacterium]
MPAHELHGPILTWYSRHGRALPWRSEERTPWGVLVSEVMLQQTPVARMQPVWEAWLRRWPRPADLAAASPADAIRAWGRLGYPRRALNLHRAATAIVQRHGGDVPRGHADLLALPGVGEYTAAAVASFAFGDRHPILDTNVRRVLARLHTGQALPGPSLTAAERRLATQLLPDAPATAATWGVATMELGALICTARTPRCPDCPVRQQCRWRATGHPPYAGPPRRPQRYAGTDRQIRGLLLAALREADGSVTAADLTAATPDSALRDPRQRTRCLAGLVADGLVEPLPEDRFRLPAATGQ